VDERDAEARIDAALVHRALRDGDPRVFEILVRRHQGLVRAQLRRLLGDDPATADDLAQDTFVLAWRKLEQFRVDARFGTWLYRITYTCFLRHLRSGRGQALDLNDVEDAGTDANKPELAVDLDAALQRLSHNQRAAVLYCSQLGLSHEEAAVVLNMPLGSVKTHVLRGKTRLRQLLHDWAPNNERAKY